MRDETLFKNPEVFEFDYVPDILLFRDSQLQSLKFNIFPALKGLSPINTILIGPPATGKTSAVKILFRELEEEEKIYTAYVNCNIDHTRHLVFSRIFREIFGFSPPSSGVPFSQLFEKIMSRLSRERKPLIVALDDAGALFHEKELDSVLNSLLRAYEMFEGVKVGVIAVFSEPDFRSLMSSKSVSIFQAQEISFPPYKKEEIYGILEKRVFSGLYSGVMGDEILEKIVEETEKVGDLRFGISMIKYAVLYAEKNARRRVVEEDLAFAVEESQKHIFTSILSSLNEKELKILEKISEVEEDVINSGELYRAVKEEIEMGYTRFYESLNKLDNMRLIHMDFTGRGHRGRTRMIRLRYPKEIVRESLKMMMR